MSYMSTKRKYTDIQIERRKELARARYHNRQTNKEPRLPADKRYCKFVIGNNKVTVKGIPIEEVPDDQKSDVDGEEPTSDANGGHRCTQLFRRQADIDANDSQEHANIPSMGTTNTSLYSLPMAEVNKSVDVHSWNNSKCDARKPKEKLKSVDVHSSSNGNCDAQTPKEKLLVARPVAAGSSGKGPPYAPENWPSPGDVWMWRVGKRKCMSGHWLDRSVHPPSYLPSAPGSKSGFHSRLSLAQYIRREFPDADVNAFFASFLWKIPAADHDRREELERSAYRSYRKSEANGCHKSESAVRHGDCNAGNKMCSSRTKGKNCTLVAKSCDICCSEAGFCRDCSCILCSETVDCRYGGFSFIRCEATVDQNFICGHVAHMDCAFRAYLAGKIGGSTDLDAQYYCRRCDNRTDLITHANKLIKTCGSLDSREAIGEILNLGSSILRGSEQERAKHLQEHIAVIMAMLNHGVPLGEIWKKEDDTSPPPAGEANQDQSHPESPPITIKEELLPITMDVSDEGVMRVPIKKVKLKVKKEVSAEVTMPCIQNGENSKPTSPGLKKSAAQNGESSKRATLDLKKSATENGASSKRASPGMKKSTAQNGESSNQATTDVKKSTGQNDESKKRATIDGESSERAATDENRPTFKATLRAWNFRHSSLLIPMDFKRAVGLLNEHTEVCIKDLKGKSWVVGVFHASCSTSHMIRGWPKVARANELKEGDQIRFNLLTAPEKNKPMILQMLRVAP